MEDTVKDRLLQFLKAEDMSRAEFARRMGLSVAYVSAMRKSLPEEKVVRMTEIFPRLNRDWLLYGEGEMYTDGDGGPQPCLMDEGLMVPLLPVEAYAGNLQEFSRGVALRECSIIACPVKGAEMAIPISGDSMEPQIQNGTIAAISRINDRAFIPWGNPMVVDTENGVLVKVVLPSEESRDCIRMHSYNPCYPDFNIPKSSIYGIYRIVAYMRKVSTM